MDITAIRQKGLKAILGGEHSLEYRDRVIGIGMLVIGLTAMSFVPEYRALSEQFHSNFLGPDMIYRALFCISMFAVIGPCLLLPYRFGAMPIIFAVIWSAHLINLEFGEQSMMHEPQVERVHIATDSGNRPELGS